MRLKIDSEKKERTQRARSEILVQLLVARPFRPKRARSRQLADLPVTSASNTNRITAVPHRWSLLTGLFNPGPVSRYGETEPSELGTGFQQMRCSVNGSEYRRSKNAIMSAKLRNPSLRTKSRISHDESLRVRIMIESVDTRMGHTSEHRALTTIVEFFFGRSICKQSVSPFLTGFFHTRRTVIDFFPARISALNRESN